MWTGPLVGDLQRANPREISESVLPEDQMQGALPVLDSEWLTCHSYALQEPSGKFTVFVFDFSQGPFIGPIECLW